MRKILFMLWFALSLPLCIKLGSALLNVGIYVNTVSGTIDHEKTDYATRQIIDGIWINYRIQIMVWAIGLITLLILSIRHERKERIAKKESV